MNEPTTGHLWYPEQLAESVLRGKETTALCGKTDTFTRDRFDGKFHNVCARCVEKAADIQGDNAIQFTPPSDWTGILERAVMYFTEPKIKPTYTFTFKTNWPS